MKNIILGITSILILVIYSFQNGLALSDGFKWGVFLYIFILLCDWIFIGYFAKEFNPMKEFVYAKVFIFKDDGLNWLNLFSWVIAPFILILGIILNEKVRTENLFESIGLCAFLFLSTRLLFWWFSKGKSRKNIKILS